MSELKRQHEDNITGDGDTASLESKRAKPDDDQAELTVAANSEALVVQPITSPSTAPTRLKKKKVGILMGFLGANYTGMQYNPGFATIEGELQKALWKAGAISDANHGDFGKVGFSRAARTDKGVSAAGMVMEMKYADHDEMVAAINAQLPPDIRIHCFTKVTGGFDARSVASSRRYEYLLPTFALRPRIATSVQGLSIYGLVLTLSAAEFSTVLRGPDPKPWKFDAAARERLTTILKKFEGTHRFHNFTRGKERKQEDMTAQRYVISFTCTEPFEMEGTEYVRLKVEGQSFVLNQIRKMVGLTIAIMVGYAPMEVIDAAFQLPALFLPKAPGLGLCLDRVVFDRYDKRFAGTDGRGSLMFPEYADRVEAFKQDVIFAYMAHTEKTQRIMSEWLNVLDEYHNDFSNAIEQAKLLPPPRPSRKERIAMQAAAAAAAAEQSDEQQSHNTNQPTVDAVSQAESATS